MSNSPYVTLKEKKRKKKHLLLQLRWKIKCKQNKVRFPLLPLDIIHLQIQNVMKLAAKHKPINKQIKKISTSLISKVTGRGRVPCFQPSPSPFQSSSNTMPYLRVRSETLQEAAEFRTSLS